MLCDHILTWTRSLGRLTSGWQCLLFVKDLCLQARSIQAMVESEAVNAFQNVLLMAHSVNSDRWNTEDRTVECIAGHPKMAGRHNL